VDWRVGIAVGGIHWMGVGTSVSVGGGGGEAHAVSESVRRMPVTNANVGVCFISVPPPHSRPASASGIRPQSSVPAHGLPTGADGLPGTGVAVGATVGEGSGGIVGTGVGEGSVGRSVGVAVLWASWLAMIS
jgi:hypothetical protein